VSATKLLIPGASMDLDEVSRIVAVKTITINAAAIVVPSDWQGLMVRFAQACAVTVPSGLPNDFWCGWSQDSVGAVTFVQGAGATLQSLGGLLVSGGQYAMGGLMAWGANTVRLYGQMA